MTPPGPRAKSRTHATNPRYERRRRERAAALTHTEKQEERRSREGGPTADCVTVHEAVQHAMGLRNGTLPRLILNWRPVTW